MESCEFPDEDAELGWEGREEEEGGGRSDLVFWARWIASFGRRGRLRGLNEGME